MPVLTAILLCPAAALVLVLLVPAGARTAVRWISLLSSLVATVLSLWVWLGYDAADGGMQFVERIPWVEPSASPTTSPWTASPPSW